MNQGIPKHQGNFVLRCLPVLAWAAWALVFSPSGGAAAASSFNLLEARERGTLTAGPAKASVTPTVDEVTDKDVLEFSYSLSEESVASLWVRGFPAELNEASVNTAQIGLRLPASGQADQILVTAEFKGPKGVQATPLRLKSGWNSLQIPIDWEEIGRLEKISFVVSPREKTGPLKGTLSLALEFVQRAPPEKLIASKKTFPLFNLFDAGEKGVFNIGPSKGVIRNVFDEALGREIWAFDYSVPVGSIVGVWTKSYSSDLAKKSVDAVKIGVGVPSVDELNQAAVKVEIKGSAGVQTIPLNLKAGRNSFGEPLHWNTIGELREAVFVVMPMTEGFTGGSPVETARTSEASWLSGTLYFDLEFGRLNFFEKNLTFLKAGLVVSASLLLALLTALLGKRGESRHCEEFRQTRRNDKAISEQRLLRPAFWAGLAMTGRDFFWGLAAVLIGGTAVALYSLGTVNPLDEGLNLNFLGVAVLGAGIAEFLKFGLLRKHLTPSEVFQNVLVTGLLAVASSRQELLQSPSSGMQMFMFNHLIAAMTFLIYHISNACRLASSGRSLKALTALLIVGTPYLFNWLLLVENPALLEGAVNSVTGQFLTRWPAFLEGIGRLLVVFVFNEAITNGMGLATQGRVLKTFKAHLFILFVSLGVVVSPWIADLGSIPAVGLLPPALGAPAAILATLLSFGGLWGEVYLITGVLLDGGHRKAPTWESLSKHVTVGMKKGMAYSGILMGLLYALHLLLGLALSQSLMAGAPIGIGILAGALTFPLLKTIIETFDGSLPFFERVRFSYRQAPLYVRGAVAGFGFAVMAAEGLFQAEMSRRVVFGLVIGLLASGGVSLLRDAVYQVKGQGRIQSWRLYLIDSLLGIFVGSAAAFYLDRLQIPVVIEKFKLYTSSGFSAVDYVTYPLVNKWGRIDLGSYTGGAKLIYLESLAGVINWSIAAWLFAINKVFLQAFFEKDTSPIKFFFSKAGFAQLIEHMIYVLRWGLWMAPIIFTFLRMMPNPTWYNQDGAVRTLFAIYQNAALPPEAFQAWSLKIFIFMMAFDFLRILIWMDHMGLRVATLVNLSFIGLDRLDERIARFIGPAAAQRYIPEAVKRFATWAPLLIPFYIPRGEEWGYAWSTSEAMQNAARGKGFLSWLQSLTFVQMLEVIGSAVLASTLASFVIRSLQRRSRARRVRAFEIQNREYQVVLKENGELHSEALQKEHDLTRRSYDPLDPSGRILFLVDPSQKSGSAARFWPVAGNFPKDRFEPSRITGDEDSLRIFNVNHNVKTTVEIRLPDPDTPAELWEITVENLTDEVRSLKIVPYLEWVLNGGIHDRFHTQYARLFPEMEYVSEANAILAWHKGTKAMGILAADIPPEGLLTSRMDFIGRARSVWDPRIFETLHFQEARASESHPTFDPIGSLLIPVEVGPKASQKIRLMMGFAKNKEAALPLIQKYLKPQPASAAVSPRTVKESPLIGHGEIPPGTPEPYAEFTENGAKLLVHTPFTPRPYDHALSNAVHSVMVTNRGLHTSSNGNSQQNRLTPDSPDTVTKEVPAEAIYLYDPDQNEWFSPTYHPLNDRSAKHESEFGVDGTAVFRMTKGTLSTELTVFVPPDDPAGVYLLTVKNHAKQARRIRVAPYFQMALAFQPERSGPLQVKHDKASSALFFKNPRNLFRTGWAFASMSLPAERVETKRGRFFGAGRGTAHPFLVEKGEADVTELTDARQIAGFLGTMELPAGGESTVAVILGQTDGERQALEWVRKYKSIEAAQKSLTETREWWTKFTATVEVETNQPEFDQLQNWLKYQALAERIWPRRGFYQTSGAFGFRDQLQDTVNLIWVDPALARKQILLHASHQFIEGDVYHWFFTLTDGRTAFACRSHASDNPLWLAWAAAEYVRATGDDSLLDEMTSYVASEFPFAPLPKNKQGWGHLYHRSTRADSVYRHCLRSINLVLEKRMGKHDLPLMGTGDWNDGLDEIGSEGKGESVWLGFFLYYILKEMLPLIEKKEGTGRKEHYLKKMESLKVALDGTWRGDRYLRAFHDDGTEIGVKASGIWEIDALTAAWAVMAGIHPERELAVFNTALSVLEKEDTILLGWPALREGTQPYLGRSSKYPEGVRENGMYCHGVQWLVRAARILAERFEAEGNFSKAAEYRETAYRLWLKISPISHVVPEKIEIYGGQPNKQAADILTNFDPGRMIWHGYTGAAGWMLRQALEGVVGASLIKNELLLPPDLAKPRGELKVSRVSRDLKKSPLQSNGRFLEKCEKPRRKTPSSKRKIKVLPPELAAAVE